MKKPATLHYDEKVARDFEEIDKNKNGTVSAKEYSDYYAYYGYDFPVNDAQITINSLDRDLDGEMNLTEFDDYEHHNFSWEEWDEENFVEADADGDGKLSIAEATPLWNRVYSDNQDTEQVFWD